MEVSMQNLAPCQVPWEVERDFPSTPNETKSIYSSHLLYFALIWELQ